MHSNQLPSLVAVGVAGNSRDLYCTEFAKTLPSHVVRYSKKDVFGSNVIGHSFNRAELRTPPEIRKKIVNPDEPLSGEAKRELNFGKDYALIKRFEETRRLQRLERERLQHEEEAIRKLKEEAEQEYEDEDGNCATESVFEEFATFDKDKYVGPNAKKELYDLYKRAKRDLAVYVKTEDIPAERRTPRSSYIREVEKRKVPPLSLILRKENNVHGVHLANRGLGDDNILPLIEIIEQLPFLDTIDLNDNRLTDVSLMPLMLKLTAMTTLTHLDLSYNKIDDSSEVIMEYIKSPNCKLITLVLNGADVDDGEACNLADAISHNTSISTLCLGHNLLGKDEHVSMIDHGVITGAVGIGAMLEVNSTLTKLDLSWNSIRSASAEKFANSLKKNTTLVELLLGHNGFGDNATQIVGRILKSNKTLEVLDLSYNSLHPRSISVLTNSLVFNQTIALLKLDGNILGRVGAQAMVAAIQRTSGTIRKLNITFNECDCRREESGLFDPANPAGVHIADLAQAYGQMLADELFYLANYRAGVVLVSLEYSASSNSVYKKIPLVIDNQQNTFNVDEFKASSKTVAAMILDSSVNEVTSADALCKLLRIFQFRMIRKHTVPIVRLVKQNWEHKLATGKLYSNEQLCEVLLFEVFFALFVINDEDCSGTIDVDEFVQTVDSLGMSITPDAAAHLMEEFDKDKSGSIDANEFSTILVEEFCRTDSPKGRLMDPTTMKPWIIPSTGTIRVEIDVVCDAPCIFDVGDDKGIDSIIEAMKSAKSEDQKQLIFEQAVNSPYSYMSAAQAQYLLEELAGPQNCRMIKHNKFYLLIASLMPQLVSAEQCCKFINGNLSEQDKLGVRVLMGPIFNAYTGQATGHYAFDLKIPKEVIYLRKLATVANTEVKSCKNIECNTSQHGNYSRFRNERLDGECKNFRLTQEWIAQSMRTQRITVDYISSVRPKQGLKALPINRFQKLMEKLDLGSIERLENEIDHAIHLDNLMKQEAAEVERAKFLELEAIRMRDMRKSIVNTNKAVMKQKSMRMLGALSVIGSQKSMGELDAASLTPPAPLNSPSPYATSPMFSRQSSELGGAPNTRDSDVSTALTSVATALQINKALVPPPVLTSLKLNIDKYMNDITEPLTPFLVRDFYSEAVDSCHLYLDVYPQEKPRNYDERVDPRPITPTAMKLTPKPDKNLYPPIFPYAYRKLLELQCFLVGMYLSAEQAGAIIKCFPSCCFLRVICFQTLFGMIVDIDNLSYILDKVLHESERWEALHRMGILNIYDPLYPDKHFKLDLRRWDHREWSKVLINLAITEPGNNWVNAEYRWGKYDEPVPGWELPQTWTEPDNTAGEGGPRYFGWMRVTYTSHGHGCAPNVNNRKLLRKRVLAGAKSYF